jgi:hypothetical protein
MTVSTPRHFLKISMNEKELKREVIALHKAGVQPLSIAVKMNVRAKRVMKILSRAKLISEYEPQCWSLSDQFI